MVFHKDRAACTSATLAHDLYHDLDMAKAHPNLPLLMEGERGGLPCQHDYVNKGAVGGAAALDRGGQHACVP
jgi:hypothetical protein